MQIDWITVSAQIVNFLILVWLLKRFLYQPVMRTMDCREKRIADQLNEVEEREQQAEEKIQLYQEKREGLEHERDDILSRTNKKAEQQKKQMLDEAREEVARKRENWQRQASDEKKEFMSNLRHKVAEASQNLARKTLSELADSDLEERVAHVFIERLKSLDKKSRQTMVQADEPAHITSAFKLDSATRSRLTRAVHQHLADGIEVEYEQSPQLVCGIELSIGGQKLNWDLADYMKTLEEHIDETFNSIEVVNETDNKEE